MRISDWSSDVCSSDLVEVEGDAEDVAGRAGGEGVVEREQAWLDRVDGETGDRAGELGREGGAPAGLGAGLGAARGVPRRRSLGEGGAVGEVGRRLEALGQAVLEAGANDRKRVGQGRSGADGVDYGVSGHKKKKTKE